LACSTGTDNLRESDLNHAAPPVRSSRLRFNDFLATALLNRRSKPFFRTFESVISQRGSIRFAHSRSGPRGGPWWRAALAAHSAASTGTRQCRCRTILLPRKTGCTCRSPHTSAPSHAPVACSQKSPQEGKHWCKPDRRASRRAISSASIAGQQESPPMLVHPPSQTKVGLPSSTPTT